MSALLSRAPRWLVLLFGLVCILLGLALIVRPLAALSTLVLLVGLSLIVSDIADLLTAQSPAPRLAVGVSLIWVVAGIVVLAWPRIAVRALFLIVGIRLIIAGVGKGVDALLSGALDERIASGACVWRASSSASWRWAAPTSQCWPSGLSSVPEPSGSG